MELSEHRKYRISLWDKFLKKAQKECRSCDHYYTLVFTMSHRWAKGNFCLHWPEHTDLMEFDNDGWSKRICKRPYFDSCNYYRNRKSVNPYNTLRKNKEYIDMTGGRSRYD